MDDGMLAGVPVMIGGGSIPKKAKTSTAGFSAGGGNGHGPAHIPVPGPPGVGTGMFPTAFSIPKKGGPP